MKFFITLIIAFVFALPLHAKAGDVDNIISALKQGSAERLSQYFDNILDIKLPEKEEVKNIGKTQASITLRNFFDENNIKGFEPGSQRDMGGTMYLAGKLQGSNKSYNITLMMKNRNDKVAIITVRINE